MAELRCLAAVRLWDHAVGGIAELDDGSIIFEYEPEFLQAGLDVSPFRLPRVRGPQQFAELRRKESFQGLPGVFADSLPDDFGNRVIRSYYAARGQADKAMSPVQRLLYVGERAIGALTYHPAVELPARPAELESLELVRLVQEARKVIEGTPDVSIPEIYRIGASAGGKRPKALVLYDPSQKTLRSGYAVPRPGEVPSILKFDGVGDADHQVLQKPLPFNRIEAAYAAMARDAGIEVSALQILESAGGYAHLLMRRFDVGAEGRLHQHTLGGMLHVDYNEPGASSYEEYLRTCLALRMPPAAIREAYLRMLFNVVAVNQDDHVKNLSFHLHQDGEWTLTPAYDLTFARGQGFTRQHQMRVADKQSGITRSDLLGIGRAFSLRSPEQLLEQVIDVVGQWATYAGATDVPRDALKRIQGELDTRRREIG